MESLSSIETLKKQQAIQPADTCTSLHPSLHSVLQQQVQPLFIRFPNYQPSSVLISVLIS